MVAQVIVVLNFVPQIFKNIKLKSTEALSVWFIALAVIAIICDIISAWTLNWDYPSKIGPPLQLIAKFMILYQMYYYRQLGSSNNSSESESE